MTSIITLGMPAGPLLTRRGDGETIVESVKRHKVELRACGPIGDRLTTTWQVPEGQEIVTTLRRTGETDAALLERHLSALPFL